MILMRLALLLGITCFTIFKAQASQSNFFEGQIWHTTICNTCTTEQEFLSTASFYNIGKVTIFNLESGQIRTYKAEMGTQFGDVTMVPVATPNEATDALNKYYSLKSYLSSISLSSSSNMIPGQFYSNTTSISGPFGGICGPEGETLATFIPDGIFVTACSAHDQCYASASYSKMFCDDLFREAMLTSIREKTDDLDIFLKKLTRLALEAAADKYYEVVVENEGAFDAYCGVTDNANTDFCLAGHQGNQLNLNGSGGATGLPYDGSVSYGFQGITLSYEYRCYPTRVYDGELTWINQFCEFVLVSN